MIYKGGCHCGQIAFEVEGELTQVTGCNCSICSRMGALHWFVPRDKLLLLTPESALATYTFGTETIRHHFCPRCGIHPFGEGTDPSGNRKAAVNTRCLEGVDLSSLSVMQVDGRSR
jgi:hypothetical protein